MSDFDFFSMFLGRYDVWVVGLNFAFSNCPCECFICAKRPPKIICRAFVGADETKRLENDGQKTPCRYFL